MKLRDYLYIHRIAQSQFAKVLGISRQHLVAVIGGRYRPSKKLCLQIERETKGLVTYEEMRNQQSSIDAKELLLMHAEIKKK